MIVGIFYRKRIAEAKVGVAEDRANKIVDEAVKDAEARKKEILLEAKEDSIRTKNELEKEVRDRRNELQRNERRLFQKEEALDRKTESLERKEEQMSRKLEDLERQKEEAKELREKQLQELERISGLTTEEAKNYILAMVETDVKHEATLMIKEIESKAKMEADKRSREIVANAIQRCAVDHVAETTVSVVQLPNDEMKGRIIGREGRNIRALETLTGIDLIIDDTPEAVIPVSTLSAERLPESHWKNSLWTGVCILPVLKKWWKKPRKKWKSPFVRKAKLQHLIQVSTGCIPNWFACWANSNTEPATVRTY